MARGRGQDDPNPGRTSAERPVSRRDVVVQRREFGILSRDDGEELVLLDLHSSRYLTLNRTGGVLWKAIERPQTVRDLVALLVSVFAVTESTAEAAIETFLDALADRGLLEPLDKAP